MFIVIYEKDTGRVVTINYGDLNEKAMEDALPENQSYITVEELPERDFYRQYFYVENQELYTGNYDLTPEQEEKIEEMEIIRLRNLREQECFPIINRGQLWYKNLTEEQINELEQWYKDYLDITITKIIPQKPEWLK